MAESKFDQEMALNRQAYERMREQIRRDYAGQYVAIALGKLIGVGPDFHSAKAFVDRLSPQPEHALVFAAEEEPAFEVVDSFYDQAP
jgi:hypothetical protein